MGQPSENVKKHLSSIEKAVRALEPVDPGPGGGGKSALAMGTHTPSVDPGPGGGGRSALAAGTRTPSVDPGPGGGGVAESEVV